MHETVAAHDGGVNAVSWGPSTEPSILSKVHLGEDSTQAANEKDFVALPPKRIVSGSIDGKVKIWHCVNGKFQLD